MKEFTSATHAAGGTQTFFESDGRTYTGRVYNKVCVEGTYEFAFMFANITDSTFADGSRSTRNMPGEPWLLSRASVAVTNSCDPLAGESRRAELRFGSMASRRVQPGEIFHSDPVVLTVKKGQYLSIETEFSGRKLPCHEESVVPIYRLTENGWQPDVRVPIPAFTGCSRKVAKRVCFWGDSITQGCGTVNNSYTHYAAKTAELIGDSGLAYWNIGFGYARGHDASTCGVWMDKARTNDVVSVCFGVNDICTGSSAEKLIGDLKLIVSELKKSGCRVLVQTVPPFDYCDVHTEVWNRVNRFIMNDPALGADAVFDCVKILGQPEHPQLAKYGGHPNAEGCLAWAKGLAPVLKELIYR